MGSFNIGVAKMRPDSVGKHVISVEKQMMRGDGCGNPFVFREDKLDSLLGRNMLNINLQLWQFRSQWAKNLINEAFSRSYQPMRGDFTGCSGISRSFFRRWHDLFYRSYATV